MVELLEHRRLLAADVQLIGTVLVVSFDDGADETVSVSITPTGYEVTGANISSDTGTISGLVVTDAGKKSASSISLLRADQLLTSGVTIDANVDAVTIADDLNTAGGSVSIAAASITLAANVTTGAGDQIFAGDVLLAQPTSLSATTGNVTFGGSLNGPAFGEKSWVTQAVGGRAEGKSISSLADGGSIISGRFVGTTDFGGTVLTSAGGQDVFIARLDADGGFAWATRAGGPSQEEVNGIATLADGSSIVTGSFQGIAEFGDTQLTSAGDFDVFIAKLNPDGSWSWATRAGGSSQDNGNGIATLADGSSIITGSFRGTTDFGSTQLISAGSVANVFIAKLNADGSWAWANRAGGESYAEGFALSTLADGSSIITGSFTGNADFGGTSLTGAGFNQDVFVAKLNPNGSFAWATRGGGGGIGSYEGGHGISTFSDGSSVITGKYSGNADFGGTELENAGVDGSTDVFIAKLSADGSWAWATRAGGTSTDTGYGISTLADGGSIVTGRFSGTVDFGSTELTSVGLYDAFFARLNADGSYAWARQAGGGGVDEGFGISTSADGSFVITGIFGGTADFGSSHLSDSGGNVFIAKLRADGSWSNVSGPSLLPSHENTTVVAALTRHPDDENVMLDEKASISPDLNGDFGESTPYSDVYGGEPWIIWAAEPGEVSVSGTSTLADGSSIVIGTFQGTAEFGTTQLTSEFPGRPETFIARLNPNGSYAWATRAGGRFTGLGGGISTFADGSSIVTGAFAGTATFGDIELNSTGAGDTDIFAAKLNADGSWVWATRAGGASQQDEGRFISTLADGSAIVTGLFRFTADFGGTELTAAGNDGSDDIFVAKLTPDGSWAWATRAGGTSQDFANGISTLVDGSSIVAGSFRGTATFDDFELTSAGQSDVFIAKLNADGSWAWATRAGGTSYDLCGGTSAHADGSSVVVVNSSGTVDFGGTELTSLRYGLSESDVFVAKLNADGSWAWATRAGGTGYDHAHSISALADGSAIITGYFEGTANFGKSQLRSYGYDDAFFAKLNRDGTWLWATQAGGSDSDFGRTISTLPNGSSIITGVFAVSFYSDVFIARLNADGTWTSAVEQSVNTPDLTISAAAITLAGRRSNLANLTIDGPAVLDGDIITIGNQTFLGSLTFTSDAALISSGSLHFGGAVDGGFCDVTMISAMRSGTPTASFTNVGSLNRVVEASGNVALVKSVAGGFFANGAPIEYDSDGSGGEPARPLEKFFGRWEPIEVERLPSLNGYENILFVRNEAGTVYRIPAEDTWRLYGADRVGNGASIPLLRPVETPPISELTTPIEAAGQLQLRQTPAGFLMADNLPLTRESQLVSRRMVDTSTGQQYFAVAAELDAVDRNRLRLLWWDGDESLREWRFIRGSESWLFAEETTVTVNHADRVERTGWSTALSRESNS